MATVKDSPTVPSLAPSRSLLGAVIGIGLCIFVELFVLATRGRIGAIVADFELDLSLVTVVAIGWVLPTLLAALILVAIIKEFIPALRQRLHGSNGVIVLIGLGCFAFYIAGIFMPLFSLINALG